MSSSARAVMGRHDGENRARGEAHALVPRANRTRSGRSARLARCARVVAAAAGARGSSARPARATHWRDRGCRCARHREQTAISDADCR